MTDEERAAMKAIYERWQSASDDYRRAFDADYLMSMLPALLAEVERSREIVRAVADGRVTLGYPMPSPGEFVPAGTADWIRQAQALLQRDAGRDEDGQP